MRLIAAAAMLHVCACSTEQSPPAASSTGDTAGPVSVIAVAQRHFVAVPDSLLTRGGACPFECCVYGDWRADSTIPLISAPATGADSVHVIRAGEPFRADSGFVRVTGPGIVAVLDTVHVRGVTLVPGDTLVILDYVGEGHWNLLHRGRVLEEVAGFWGAEHDDPKGAYYGDYRKEWWVRATHAGVTGWFRADSTFEYSGADACGG